MDRWPREGLVPLAAARPYDASWSEPRRVHRDCHFAWEGNRYSILWAHGGTAVLVRHQPIGALEVKRDGRVIARHTERVPGRGETVTLPEHVAGLWQRTLGRKRTYDVDAPDPRRDRLPAARQAAGEPPLPGDRPALRARELDPDEQQGLLRVALDLRGRLSDREHDARLPAALLARAQHPRGELPAEGEARGRPLHARPSARTRR